MAAWVVHAGKRWRALPPCSSADVMIGHPVQEAEACKEVPIRIRLKKVRSLDRRVEGDSS